MDIVDNKRICMSTVWKILYAIVFLCIVVFFIYLSESEEFDRVHSFEGDGEYIIHPDPLIPRDSPDMLIAEDGKIFLFYIDEELINVYTTSGSYLYGFQFPDGRNGRSDMHYENGLLYVNARGSGIYVFQDAELLRFEEQNIHNPEHSKIEKVFAGDDDAIDTGYIYVYVEDANKIIRSNAEKSETVLQFPERKYDPISFLLLVSFMLLLGDLIWTKKQNSN